MRTSIRPLMMATVCLAVMIGVVCSIAYAQQPKLEMHRAGTSADDGSGWHAAASTKGSFAIQLPLPFNDFTTHDASTGEVTHVVGGKSWEGIKFMAVEATVTAEERLPISERSRSLSPPARPTRCPMSAAVPRMGWTFCPFP